MVFLAPSVGCHFVAGACWLRRVFAFDAVAFPLAGLVFLLAVVVGVACAIFAVVLFRPTLVQSFVGGFIKLKFFFNAALIKFARPAIQPDVAMRHFFLVGVDANNGSGIWKVFP